MFSDPLNWLRGIVMVCGGGIVALLGGYDTLLEILLILMVLDYGGGVVSAAMTRTLSSTIGFKGIVKKTGYLILVIVACAFDRAMQFPAPLARTLVLLFLIANESLSLIEHLAQFGVPIPKWLVERLHKLQEETNQGVDNRGGEHDQAA